MPILKRRSTVRTSGLIPKRGRPAIWGFGYADLALLFGMKEKSVQQAVCRGQLDPGDLGSLCRFWQRRQEKAARRLARRGAG